MGSYTLLKNSSIVIDLPTDYSDQGWTISDNIASHSGCNSGYIEKVFDLSSAASWTFRYTILALTSGTINLVVNGVNGPNRNAAGTYEETFAITGPNRLIRFFSTGVNSIKVLKIFETSDADNSITLAFNEGANKWVTYYSFKPEMTCKFLNDFFTFKDGSMWEQNVNPIRNNFFGVQYPSIITFYVNLSPSEVKNFFNMRQKSTTPWTSPNNGDIFIPGRKGKPQGQRSRLKEKRFKRLQGDWFVEFLRDLDDPRFLTADEALFKGALLQGNYMKITMQNNNTEEERLLSVDVTVGVQQYSY